MDRTTLLNGFKLNMDYTMQLIADVDEAHMTSQPGEFTNHPAFTIGHLVTGTALTVELLGQGYHVPEGWDELFRRKGPGDPTLPTERKDKYPSKAALIKALQEKYEQVVALIESAEEKTFDEPCSWKLASYMPTVGEVLYFQCLLHHSWHIGQLAEWRRMMGYDSALKKLMK